MIPQKSTSKEENASLRYFSADLHIHTCLSPCSDWEMSPKKIVAKSIEKQLDIIAICDHNSAENVQAAIRLGEELGLRVLPGMEICSREEVHILGLFKAVEQVQAMQEFVYEHLPGENQAEVFGYQVIVNENDEIVIKDADNGTYFKDHVALDLDVSIPKNSWVRGRGANVELIGALKIDKE